MTDLFRIRYSTGKDYAEGTKDLYFENKLDFAKKLLEIKSEQTAYPGRSATPRTLFFASVERYFRKLRGAPDLSEARHAWYVKAVEYFQDNTWQPVDYRFEPAHLIVNGVDFSETFR